MSHELLYTSAQHGLKPGSYGFCTVMATDGLSKALQDRLESLSGYEHAFAVTDKRAPLNPVNYSHLIVTVANQRLHLLSRVADAGADYSGRSNKLAHHVVLQPTELTAASPASTLASQGFCKTSFDGTPKSLPHGVLPPLDSRSLTVCEAWENVCKDAGWAGYLAEQTLQNPSRPITLIYAPGCDVLPLVVEAISLLPADRQWRTTFSTFFTKLPAGVECQWRFVLDGTSAADQARRNLQAPPIDLTSPGTIPSEGPLVDAARTGKMPVASPVVTAGRSPATSRSGSKSTPTNAAIASGTPTETSAETYRPGTVPSRVPGTSGTPLVDDPFAKRRRSPMVTLIAAIGGSLAALALIVGLSIHLFNGTRQPEIVQTTKDPVESVEKPELLVRQEAPKKELVAAKNDDPTTIAKNTASVEKPAVEVPLAEKPLTFNEIMVDIKSKGGVLSLPKREQGLASPVGEHELCKIFVKNPTDCELNLVTTEVMPDGQPRLFLTRGQPQADGVRSWTASVRARNSILDTLEEMPIGEFTLKDQSLIFEWKQAPDWTSPFGLLYCKLDVKVGSQATRCSLTKPTIKPLDRLELTQRKASMPVDITAGTLSSVKYLRYDLELHLDDWTQSKSGVNATDQNLLKFEVPAGDSKVDLELHFVTPTDKRDASFAYRTFVYPTFLREIQGPGWVSVTKRNDEMDELSKEGFIVPDFDRMRKEATDARKKASVSVAAAKKVVMQLEIQVGIEKNQLKAAIVSEKVDRIKSAQGDLVAAETALQAQHNLVRHYQQGVEHGDATFAWIEQMKGRYKAIQEKLEVRFTIYLEFLSDSKVEQVVLVETNPRPSTREAKPSNHAKVGEIAP